MKLTYLVKSLFFVPFLFSGTLSFGYLPMDSLGIVSKNGKNYIQHKVDKGNTLFSLSRRYNVKTTKISEANNNVTVLKLNSVVLIPTSSIIHTVGAGETLYSISRKYNVSVGQIAGDNKLKTNALSLGQKLIIEDNSSQIKTNLKPAKDESEAVINGTKATNKIHIVKPGETLYSISRAHSVSLDRVQKLNSLAYGKLSPGDTLKVPAKAKTEEVKELDIVKSNSTKLNQNLCEILSPVGKTGDIVKLQSNESPQIVYARIIASSPDNKIYASKRTYDLLKLKTFTSRIKFTYTK